MDVYYPVFLSITGKRCVVIGGGKIAEGKVDKLLECGATVTVVSPVLTRKMKERSNKNEFTHLERTYQKGDIAGAYLALVATDDNKVNQSAADEARELGILVNTADDVKNCDFIAPAIVQRGDLTIAVSTAGRSPAMARRVREELEELFTPDYADLLTVLGDARTALRKSGLRPDAEEWQKAIDSELKSMVRRGELEAAKDRLVSTLEKHT
ncbi:MAG: bifunctional precorrin-2 dehydrogenase/sirohydrochlorin ferrochelatase [Dehalococcoidia bacterium]|nr:bifunctional precorrin-2 dehydrogenase/sirohydrochlorin ferrochelatase [Dehalococcoidia bacterium]